MDKLLELVEMTEKLLCESEKNLRKIQEMKIPEIIICTTSIVKRYNELRIELAQIKERFWSVLGRLALSIKERGPLGNHYHIKENGDIVQETQFHGSQLPIEDLRGFYMAILEKATIFLEKKPKCQLEEINQLVELAQEIVQTATTAKK